MAFTPIFDELLQLVSPTDALVFGAVWRFAQGELQKCIASPETIGDRIGMTGRTVKRSLKTLCDQGLLDDRTPNIMHKPHDHVPTKKALALIEKVGQNVIPKPDEVGQSDTPRDDKMSHQVGQNVPARCDKMSHIRKNKETIKKQAKKKGGKPPPLQPKTVLKDEFLELSHLLFPGNKKQQGFWWSQFGEIFHAAGKDLDAARAAQKEVINYMLEERLTISGPQSLINLIRTVISGQPLINRNGASNGSSYSRPRRTQKNNLATGLGEYTPTERAELGLD